jgi:hypothetical protein
MIAIDLRSGIPQAVQVERHHARIAQEARDLAAFLPYQALSRLSSRLEYEIDVAGYRACQDLKELARKMKGQITRNMNKHLRERATDA